MGPVLVHKVLEELLGRGGGAGLAGATQGTSLGANIPIVWLPPRWCCAETILLSFGGQSGFRSRKTR